jgi:hypothetical protein
VVWTDIDVGTGPPVFMNRLRLVGGRRQARNDPAERTKVARLAIAAIVAGDIARGRHGPPHVAGYLDRLGVLR